MLLHPVHQRLAELTILSAQRELTFNEDKEWRQCLQVNLSLCYEAAKIVNLSYIAYEINDVDWQHTICSKQEDFVKRGVFGE
jgi:hypothetical protein